MGVRKMKPVTPGQRHKIISNFDDLTGDAPKRSLLRPLKSTGGRNNTGRMTVRNRGGGHKRRYRVVDFHRNRTDGAVVRTVEYDPNRSSRISLVEYGDGEFRYILTPHGVEVGQTIYSGAGAEPEVGNTLRLGDIPLGTVVHNVELRPGSGGVMVRSAGTGAVLLSREGKYASLRLPSGEVRLFLVDCCATVGSVSNSEHILQKSGKAGRSRWLGRRPRTRGVAMNPVDHPMGGGEGKASGGHPRSRKGQLAKGYKTRRRRNPSDRFIVERRKRK